ICTALFVTEYAPARLRRPLTSFVDVLAAVPSIIYGLWGLYFLEPRVVPVSRWLGTHVGFIPIFHTKDARQVSASSFIAGIVVALRYSESSEFGISALLAAGLSLFVITLIVSAFAPVGVSRSRAGSAPEI